MKFIRLALLLGCLNVSAAKPVDAIEVGLLDSFWDNVSDSFSGTNLLLHGGAFGSTALLIGSGIDARVQENFSHAPNYVLFPGALIGSGIVAVGVGVPMYFVGKSSGNIETIGTSIVILQAAAITAGYVSILKAITGRPHPDNDSSLSMQEQSEVFRWGFFRGGIFYGWPSGHVSHTVAVTSALAYYYPDKSWLAWMSVGLSTYMLATISGTNYGQMHWFSDGVAGAMMGYAVGSSVGKNLRRIVDGKKKGKEPEVEKVSWMPLLSPGFVGGSVTIQY